MNFPVGKNSIEYNFETIINARPHEIQMSLHKGT